MCKQKYKYVKYDTFADNMSFRYFSRSGSIFGRWGFFKSFCFFGHLGFWTFGVFGRLGFVLTITENSKPRMSKNGRSGFNLQPRTSKPERLNPKCLSVARGDGTKCKTCFGCPRMVPEKPLFFSKTFPNIKLPVEYGSKKAVVSCF